MEGGLAGPPHIGGGGPDGRARPGQRRKGVWRGVAERAVLQAVLPLRVCAVQQPRRACRPVLLSSRASIYICMGITTTSGRS